MSTPAGGGFGAAEAGPAVPSDSNAVASAPASTVANHLM